jgi:hypothetical protein
MQHGFKTLLALFAVIFAGAGAVMAEGEPQVAGDISEAVSVVEGKGEVSGAVYSRANVDINKDNKVEDLADNRNKIYLKGKYSYSDRFSVYGSTRIGVDEMYGEQFRLFYETELSPPGAGPI